MDSSLPIQQSISYLYGRFVTLYFQETLIIKNSTSSFLLPLELAAKILSTGIAGYIHVHIRQPKHLYCLTAVGAIYNERVKLILNLFLYALFSPTCVHAFFEN